MHPHEHGASFVSLSTEIDLLRLDLVGNVDEQDVEVLVALVVRLEDYLDDLLRHGRDRVGRWHEQEGSLLGEVLDARDF